MNEWALITGASAGIGLELARSFAVRNFNLVLTARNEGRLNEVADELRSAQKVDVLVVPNDLARPQAPAEIFDAVRGTPISVLVNNAGFGTHGPFAQTELGVQKQMLEVNIAAVVELTHRFLPPMLERGHGRILNVASTAAFQPGPTVNIYYASKAFVFSFSYAIAVELAGTGVTVTTLCPGMTRTEFFQRAHMQPRNWAMMEPRAVAEAGFRGLMKGKRVVIPGLLNQISSFLAKRMPPRLTSAVVRRIH
jgi:short-subunit dehydrogenase